MKRGIQSNQVHIGRLRAGRLREKQMRLAVHLSRSRTVKCPANRARWKLRVESAPRIEPNLAPECSAVPHALAVEKCRCIEVSSLSLEAKWVAGVVRPHGPPVASETDYAHPHL